MRHLSSLDTDTGHVAGDGDRAARDIIAVVAAGHILLHHFQAHHTFGAEFLQPFQTRIGLVAGVRFTAGPFARAAAVVGVAVVAAAIGTAGRGRRTLLAR